jgi:hypothetical protein
MRICRGDVDVIYRARAATSTYITIPSSGITKSYSLQIPEFTNRGSAMIYCNENGVDK